MDPPGKKSPVPLPGGYIRRFLGYFGTEPVRYLRPGAPPGPVTIRSPASEPMRSARTGPARAR